MTILLVIIMGIALTPAERQSLLLAVLMAFSRLYLYVHYPTDVLGGVFVGIASGYIGYRVISKSEKLNYFKGIDR